MSKYILYFNNLDSAESHVILSLPFSSYIEEENMAIFSESGGVIQNGNITTNNCIFYSSTESILNDLSYSEFTDTILYDCYNDGAGILYTNQVITSIPDYTFYDCKELITVVLPDSVTQIGRNAFSGCLSLKSLEIPINVTRAGTSLVPIIHNCPNLESIIWNSKQFSNSSVSLLISNDVRLQITSFTFGENVEHIPAYLCKDMRNITSITIPESVTSIGNNAFYGCSSLTKTNYTGDIAGWCNIKFGNYSANPMCYSHNFYINDQEIKDLVIPNSVTSIGDGAFYDCSSLTSVTIGNSVTSIGSYAFYYCSSLTSVTIGNSVTSIGWGTFYDCSSLTSITCEATTPPTLGSNNTLSNVTAVYVPEESVDRYKTATNWSYYSSIIQPIL